MLKLVSLRSSPAKGEQTSVSLLHAKHTELLSSLFLRKPVDGRYEPFFHISIVEGDISLVLDSEALSR